MTDSQHRTDHTWKDAEALVERIERSAKTNAPPSSFFDDLTAGLRLTTAASAVAIWFADTQQQTVISRSGVSIHLDKVGGVDGDEADACEDHASRSRWLDGHSASGGQLLATQRVHDDVRLGLDLHFDRPCDLASQRMIRELVEVVLDLAANVFLRSQLSDLRRELGRQSDRDRLIGKLNEGVSLKESFAAIASAVASESLADRVSLLRRKQAQPIASTRHRLVTTSAQAKVDRRARQVRLLEKLADTVLANNDRFTFSVGTPGKLMAEESGVLEKYLHESGCREIHIESVSSEAKDSCAAIVLERFRVPADEQRSIQFLLDPIRDPLAQAVDNAMARDDAAWGMLAGRFVGEKPRQRILISAIVAAIVLLAACVFTTTLRVPVEGRIVAAQRSRLFAPAEGIVADIVVRNGQPVRAGDPLIVLHSPSLDLQQRNVAAALSTARTRLDSLLALRSGSSGLPSRQQETSVSADEQVLKTEIEGLVEQLELLQSQQAKLTITSPIDGRVDRWDLQQSLAARPVTHGQHLIDVISDSSGWMVELDLPEKNVNYVLDAQHVQPCRVTLRLRSNPTTTHEGYVDRIADVAHLDPLGQSIVRVTVPLESSGANDFRTGATVMAQIHCGQRALGFVWFRGIIEWSRSQAWL